MTLFTVFMFVSAKRRKVIHHQLNVSTKNTGDTPLKVFFISDIHRRKIDYKLLKKIGEDIDVVIIGGDLAEKGVPLMRISQNIENLSSRGPVFYAWGNNDREVGEQQIREIMRQNGVKILDNESFSVPGHPAWGICGTDDPSSGKLDINAALQDVNQYDKVIFVSHQPKVLQKVEQVFQPTIMLAGHTHGGQIRIGKLGLFTKGSLQTDGNYRKLISNGYGTSTVPLRLGAAPECHIITFN